MGKKLSLQDIMDLHSEQPELTVERNAAGSLVLEEPAGFYSGSQKADLTSQLQSWNRKYIRGLIADSSTGFLLPNGALRSPVVSWVAAERLSRLTEEELTGYPPLVPDFVIELRSPSDRLADLQEKMLEYQSVGVRLGWLIDPIEECCYLYRETGPAEKVIGFDIKLSGEHVLEGFELELQRLLEVKKFPNNRSSKPS